MAIVVIESTARPGYYLRFYALAHEGDKRWSRNLRDADRFHDTPNHEHIHKLAKRRGLEPSEYRITPLRGDDETTVERQSTESRLQG